MFNKHDIARDACQLFGAQAEKGYDWWWHSFTGYDAETGQAKPFFISCVIQPWAAMSPFSARFPGGHRNLPI